LIRVSPASNYREELVTGPGGLLSCRHTCDARAA